jgi:hypothetical protein
MTSRKSGPPRRRIDSDDPIAAGLRRLWADAEQEPVPADMIDLITRIDALAAEATVASENAQ